MKRDKRVCEKCKRSNSPNDFWFAFEVFKYKTVSGLEKEIIICLDCQFDSHLESPTLSYEIQATQIQL